MKLFGSRKNAEFARKKPERTGRMPRWARIVLIVFAVLAALVLGLLFVRTPNGREAENDGRAGAQALGNPSVRAISLSMLCFCTACFGFVT